VFAGSPAVVGPLSDLLAVDLHVPGCPPPPLEIVRSLIALMEAQA
jgi:Ni,Fe-hydrogenase III small subunit